MILFEFEVTDGNRVRRRRRQALNEAANSINKKSLPLNSQVLNSQEQGSLQTSDQNDVVSGKSGGRQYYSYQRPYGYGSLQGGYYPYAGAGVGAYQYGYGPCKTTE